ncbi:MAG: hypothetical protein LWW99_10245 [Deltaproteobacteria bacterium]|nr:hypothetical protein [Deltaproteobacteria bacterium]
MAVFSRTTIIEAVSLLDNQPHSNIDRLIIRFGLEESMSGSRQKYVKEKVNAVSSYLIEHPDFQGTNNSGLTFEVIEFLVRNIPDPDEDDSFETSQDRYFKLRNSLARDGYRVEGGKLRTILPENINLSKKESELELFLKNSDFKIARGHFEQAIDAHTRGAWAAANGQLRTFVESLFDEIAKRVVDDTPLPSSSHNRREALAKADPPFFMASLNEWEIGSKGGFVQGFWRRLHPDGSHPGLSDEEDSTFRLHLVVLVAHHFLKRFNERA